MKTSALSHSNGTGWWVSMNPTQTPKSCTTPTVAHGLIHGIWSNMASYLLKDDGFRILLEDGGGIVLDEIATDYLGLVAGGWIELQSGDYLALNSGYLLMEDDGRLALENSSGFILL